MMPTYDFVNKDDGEMETHFLRISELDKFKEDHPQLKSVISAPNIIGGTGNSGIKIDDGFKEVLSKVGEAHPGTNLSDRYAKRTIKDIKTQSVVDKHRKLQAKGN
jgi:hypothetical protein|tara:strand:+ start:298 stop:612 length:315 start_codon:yes stop_codon:yes gene_type:complete